MARKVFMPHQSDAYDYSLAVSNPALLMEMRLGKTLVATRYGQARVQEGPIIVVAPSTVIGAWEDELDCEGESYVVASSRSRESKAMLLRTVFKMPGRTWFLTTYETVVSMPLIAVQPWAMCILDESTKIKNPKAQVSLICTEGFRLAKRRVILTGLVSPESDLEIFQQFKFLDGSFMGCKNYWQFRNKYFHKDESGHGWYPKYGSHKQIKNYMHGRAFVLRRADANLVKKKIYTKRYVELTGQQRVLQSTIAKEFAYEQDGEWIETAYAPTKHLWMMRIAGGFHPDGVTQMSTAKCEALLEILDELGKEQMVVWFKFKSELAAVSKFLTKHKITNVEVSGLTPIKDRRGIIQSFRDKKYRVLLATEMTAKFGVDCSTASCAVYYSNEMSCECRTQSEERILHPMKDDPLLYIDLVTRDSVDELSVDKLQDKTFDAREMMTAFDQFVEKCK